MLIDDILVYTQATPLSQAGAQLLEDMRQATVIKIHNVADCVFEKGQKWNIEEDFPNIAPPAPRLWMEWLQDPAWIFEDAAEQGFCRRFRAGVYFSSIDLEDEDYKRLFKDTHVPNNFPDARWVVLAHFFLEDPGAASGYSAPPGFGFGVSAEGQFRRTSDAAVKLVPNPIFFDERVLNEEDIQEMSGFAPFLSIPFMALSFMHCKNVRIEKGPPHPSKLQQARMDRGKAPLVRWHTLVIDPAKAILAAANNGQSEPTPRALHICRGHFKDFRNHGLFGRYRDIYWWPMHSRGSGERGVILKDYRVHPKEGPLFPGADSLN